MKRFLPILFWVAGSLLASSALLSQAPRDESRWNFQLSPYLWAAGISGEFSQSLLPFPTLEIDRSFGEVLENLDAGAMLVFEARRGRSGLFLDWIHIRLSASGTGQGPLPLPVSADLTSTTHTALAAGQYRWLENDRGHLDILAGIRLWSIDSTITVREPIRTTRTEQVSWFDPVVGVKGLFSLSPNLFLHGWAMVGGYDQGSNPLFDLKGGVGYQLSERVAITLAYRLLDLRYKEDDFLFDARQQGFLFGLDFQF